MRDGTALIIVIGALLCISCISFVSGVSTGRTEYVQKAIENGCGQYNSTTGMFGWIKK